MFRRVFDQVASRRNSLYGSSLADRSFRTTCERVCRLIFIKRERKESTNHWKLSKLNHCSWTNRLFLNQLYICISCKCF